MQNGTSHIYAYIFLKICGIKKSNSGLLEWPIMIPISRDGKYVPCFTINEIDQLKVKNLTDISEN